LALKITQTPYKVGITGMIGVGKSLVGEYLEQQGVPVLDTDKVAHKLYEEDRVLISQIAQNFGAQTVTPEGKVDRKALGAVVFNNVEKRKLLNSIIWPRVGEKVREFIEAQKRNPIVAVMVPLLFESKSEGSYNEVWTITANEEVLIQRLMARNNLTREQALQRIAAHELSQAQKAARANVVIDNSGTKEETKNQVLRRLQEIRQAIQPAS
jgi:dephospho-CoA kinase